MKWLRVQLSQQTVDLHVPDEVTNDFVATRQIPSSSMLIADSSTDLGAVRCSRLTVALLSLRTKSLRSHFVGGR